MKLGRMFETLLAAGLGGALFSLLHIPLAWMLGPMTAAMVWSRLIRRKLVWPAGMRNAGLIVLGSMMGRSFTLETAKQIGKQLPSMLLSTLLTIAFSLLLGYFMARRAGLNRPTGIIGSIPGGLTQMVVLGEEVADTDVTAVTFMQTVRMLAVVFIVPFLAVHGLGSAPVGAATGNSGAAVSGATGLLSVRIVASIAAVLAGTWAAVKLKLPTPYLMGPMLAAGLLAIGGVAVPQVPAPLLLVAQLCVGSHLGLTMKSTSLGNWKRLLPCCLLSSGGLVLFSLMLGFFLKMWHPIDLVTGFLGTAPGGMAEMGATAVAVHADLSVVAAYQMFRILFILFVVPPLLKWWLKR